MIRDHLSIEDLRRELQTLQIATRNIERLIEDAEEVANCKETANHQEDQATHRLRNRRENIVHRAEHPVVRDRNGTEILIGDKVRFLTCGVHNSKISVVYKVSNNRARVMARNNNKRSVSRAPHNIIVLTP